METLYAVNNAYMIYKREGLWGCGGNCGCGGQHLKIKHETNKVVDPNKHTHDFACSSPLSRHWHQQWQGIHSCIMWICRIKLLGWKANMKSNVPIFCAATWKFCEPVRGTLNWCQLTNQLSSHHNQSVTPEFQLPAPRCTPDSNNLSTNSSNNPTGQHTLHQHFYNPTCQHPWSGYSWSTWTQSQPQTWLM